MWRQAKWDGPASPEGCCTKIHITAAVGAIMAPRSVSDLVEGAKVGR